MKYIIITPATVYTSMKVTIIVRATDPDEGHGNNLAYQFTSSSGEISITNTSSSSTSSAVWSAPDIADIYYIWVTATDPGGLYVEEEIFINVLNREYPPKIANGFTTPTTIKNNKPNLILLTVLVEDENGLGDIKGVTIDLSSIDGDSEQEMYDNGKNGDKISDDGYYTHEFLSPSGITPGNIRLTVTVIDLAGLKETYDLELVVEKGKPEEKSETAFLPGFQGYIAIFTIICLALFFKGRKKFTIIKKFI